MFSKFNKSGMILRSPGKKNYFHVKIALLFLETLKS